MLRSVITGSGSYIPENIQANEAFAQHQFYANGRQLPQDATEIVKKFKSITGIEERRYAFDDQLASDIGSIAAKAAIADSGANPETIDQLILAHNFGNVLLDNIQSVAVPSLACLVKHQLGISNPACVAYDILFGCPGWLQGLIQADAFFKAGIAKKALIVGTETLSRVIDQYDRDSMIFSDGAGAVVVEYQETTADGPGLLSASVQTHTLEEVNYINMGISSYPGCDPRTRYIKMNGRKVYEYALTHVPLAMKDCIDKSGVPITAIKKIFIHQANEKMDEAIIERLYQLYDLPAPGDVMPMSIQWLGNSSVATIPTLYDLVRKNKIQPHHLLPGDVILFASVGAGMNINAVCYRY
ncbi:MAG: ketoacyl-ACP synthase III [Chitinophagaceae bacterium]|nr:ketoacyl-ACP synthase III [Chitinophagaceae bacterium]